MCKYCENDKLLIESSNNGIHHLGVSESDEKGRWGLVMFTPFGMYSKEIYYCPICGRKLTDER